MAGAPMGKAPWAMGAAMAPAHARPVPTAPPAGTLLRCITSEQDMAMWSESDAYVRLLGFIMVLNGAARGRGMVQAAAQCQQRKGAVVHALLGMLKGLEAIVDDVPPVEQAQRFGNTAFRTWHTKATSQVETLLEPVWSAAKGPGATSPARSEVQGHLLLSFGNQGRLDYGTGHEFAFLAMLCCLCILEILTEEDHQDLVLVVFPAYIALCRKIQRTYMLEPAGSRGVWGLDDYQFLPFIWGAAQLEDHPHIRPKSFVKPEIYENLDKDFMFLGCIRFISSVKTGGVFAEHSPILWDVSAVPMWTKVNSGLIKMYKVEVLNKFPVMQHFLFGSLLPPTKAPAHPTP